MIVKLDRQAWGRLSQKVAADLTPLFETGRSRFGPLGAKMVAKSLRGVSLSSARSAQDIANIVVLLDAARQYDAVTSAAQALRQIPFTGNHTIFEPVRQVYALAFRRLTLLGSPDARGWEPFLSFGENGGEPGPIVMTDATTRRLDGRVIRQPWRTGPVSGSPTAHAANVCAEIRELVTMWALGGSPTWSRPKIDEEIDHNIEASWACAGS